MTTEQQQVLEFMQAFEQESPAKPCIPSLEVRKLRAKLLFEEAIETIDALGIAVQVDTGRALTIVLNNKVSNATFCEYGRPYLHLIADGLADLHYVAYCGTALACGLDMEPIFAEVHRSNMSKFWSEDDIEQKLYEPPDTKGEWFNREGHQMFITKKDDGMYLVKDKLGKAIKSPSYSPANIQRIIDDQYE